MWTAKKSTIFKKADVIFSFKNAKLSYGPQ